jgi:hydrogenase expression/formation protein HypD
MGTWEYAPLVEELGVPIVVTGFEPVDLLQGILMTVRQLEAGSALLENQYSRVVKPGGNQRAQDIISQVFTTTDQMWRGIGTIPNSGYQVREELAAFDANRKFAVAIPQAAESPDCIAGQILKGI